MYRYIKIDIIVLFEKNIQYLRPHYRQGAGTAEDGAG
jgi:hypothetical protein